MADGVNYSLKGFDQYDLLLGDELRGERATIGKSLLDVQRDLKIKASYIAAIENCDLAVFSNHGFVAGYVRSYARYLGLDQKTVYERFCLESGFSSGNSGLTLNKKRPAEVTQKNFGSESDWKPNFIGQDHLNNTVDLDLIFRFAPVIVVLVVLLGTSFGAFSVLKEVQKLDVVALEELPDIFMEPPAGLIDGSLLNETSDIYSSEELALPVFEPRDRAVSTLKPSALTALENKRSFAPLKYLAKYDGLSAVGREQSFEVRDLSKLEPLGPVVRTTPNVPDVKLLAMTPAWVRIKNQKGDVIFEKTLKRRETYRIDKELFKGILRAGNAQNVYFFNKQENIWSII
jgi:hypothetical protein